MVYNKTQMLSTVRPPAGEVQSLGDSLLVPFLGFPLCDFFILVLKYCALNRSWGFLLHKATQVHVPQHLSDRCCSKCERVTLPSQESGSYRSPACPVTAKPCCLFSGSSCLPRTSLGSAFTSSHCSEHLCWHDLCSFPGPLNSSHKLHFYYTPGIYY